MWEKSVVMCKNTYYILCTCILHVYYEDEDWRYFLIYCFCTYKCGHFCFINNSSWIGYSETPCADSTSPIYILLRILRIEKLLKFKRLWGWQLCSLNQNVFQCKYIPFNQIQAVQVTGGILANTFINIHVNLHKFFNLFKGTLDPMYS